VFITNRAVGGDRLADGLATQASVQVNGTMDADVMTIRLRRSSLAGYLDQAGAETELARSLRPL
jgi:hypothetical protein